MSPVRRPLGKIERREGVDLELKGERRWRARPRLRAAPTPQASMDAVAGRARNIANSCEPSSAQSATAACGRSNFVGRTFARATRRAGALGDELIGLLELRLDNVLARLGLAATRAQARQFISHGHIEVNGRRTNIPSFEASPGDIVQIRPGAPVEAEARRAAGLIGRVPPWFEVDHEELKGRVIRLPEPHEIQAPIDTKRIIELYSR